MSLQATPIRLNLKKDEKLEIEWQDGLKSTYPLALEVREEDKAAKSRSKLNLLPGNYSQPLTVLDAELVGGYAMRLDWSDNHGSGIYSFQYLREISPQKKEPAVP